MHAKSEERTVCPGAAHRVLHQQLHHQNDTNFLLPCSKKGTGAEAILRCCPSMRERGERWEAKGQRGRRPSEEERRRKRKKKGQQEGAPCAAHPHTDSERKSCATQARRNEPPGVRLPLLAMVGAERGLRLYGDLPACLFARPLLLFHNNHDSTPTCSPSLHRHPRSSHPGSVTFYILIMAAQNYKVRLLR